MANRDLSTFNRVTAQVAENPSGIIEGAVQLGTQIIAQSQEAKVNQNLSETQLALNELDQNFRRTTQADPFNKEAQSAYKSDRQAIITQFGEGISAQFRGQFNEGTQRLTRSSDVSNQAWGFRQSAQNTQKDINASITTDLRVAEQNGQLFATGDVSAAEALLSFASAKERVMQFATNNLGPEVAGEALENYDSDNIKMFVSGAAAQDPNSGLALLDEPGVKESFTDPAEFAKFKTAIEDNALNVNKRATRREALSALSATNGMLVNAADKPLSYAEFTLQAEQIGLSQPAQDYIAKVNGFKKPSKTRLGKGEQTQLRASVYNVIGQASKQEDLSIEDIQSLQTNLLEAMDKGAFTRDEGLQLLGQLVEPTIEGKEEQIEDFTDGDWNPFSRDVGFGGIEEYFESTVEREDAESLNNINRVNLYQNYLQELRIEAGKNDVRVGDIPNLDNRRGIYQRAQDAAINAFKSDTTPLTIKSVVPEMAIQHLLQNPSLKDSFDEMYGVGAANRVLR